MPPAYGCPADHMQRTRRRAFASLALGFLMLAAVLAAGFWIP